jgi:PBSX family phage terminase large subunit
MEVKVKRHPKFDVLYNPPDDCRMIILIGGRGGMKTYEASKAIAYHATCTNRRVQVLRDEAAKIKQSILNEVLQRYDTANKDGAFNGKFVRGENTIKDASTGNEVVFTQGFRGSTNIKTAHMKGVSGVDIGVVEELADIRDEDKFNTWRHSVRKKGSFIVVILNTPDVNHWVITRYFDLKNVDHKKYKGFTPDDVDGYFEIVPKDLPGVYVVHTSYQDNDFLPQVIKDEYAACGVKGGPYENIHYFLTEIEGYASTGMKGQIYKNWNKISNAEFNDLPYKSQFGLDFGWTSQVTTTSGKMALVEVKIHNGRAYIRELIYANGMTKEDLAIKMIQLGITPDDLIVADCAESVVIGNLRNGFLRAELKDETAQNYPQLLDGGFYVKPCTKGRLTDRPVAVSQYEIYVTSDSDGIWQEYMKYCWAVDKNGNPTDEPIDKYNDAMDAIAYVILAHGKLY